MMIYPSSARIEEPAPGFPVLRINHPQAAATIALHGAHLMEWTPAGEESGLYLSPLWVCRKGKAIRGGIPICWPWFGANPDDPALPAHGFVRNKLWEWESCVESAEGVVVTLLTREDSDSTKLWPHAFELRMELRIGKSLEAILTATNTGDSPYLSGGALHTYLAVGDVTRIGVDGLDGRSYIHALGDWVEGFRQEGPLRFDAELCRIFPAADVVQLVDEAWNRRLGVESRGASELVVWNPWSEIAAGFADLPDAGYKDFVCLEAAITGAHRVLLAPGESHTLATRVTVLPYVPNE